MKEDNRSDEELILLWKNNRFDAFSILKTRYWNYGMGIINAVVNNKAKLIALGDEKDSLIYDAVYSAITRYDESKGTFKKLFSVILKRLVLQRFYSPNRDPLIDSYSLDATLSDDDSLSFADTLILADTTSDPKIEYSIKEQKDIFINAPHNPKTTPNFEKIIELKANGYNLNEIGRMLNMSSRTIRSIYVKAKDHFVNVTKDKK